MTAQGSNPQEQRGRAGLDFEGLVRLYYEPLYRFALSLTRTEDAAGDLTQETFQVWATKGHQLRDLARAKAWLFTTLHRLFLETQRRQARFPHLELESAGDELPTVDPELVSRLDADSLLGLLGRVDPVFQAPVALFYLEDYSYQEIARILEVPLGTVKSRIARGLEQLKQLLLRDLALEEPARGKPATAPRAPERGGTP
jgi:RNA polymerase sigma factor (sigma-70 family)